MENIFIDTSVFVRENFLEGNRINELLRLFEEGRFQHIAPLITINEIKNQYKKKVTVATEEHNKAMNNRLFDCLRNYKDKKDRLTKFPKAKTISVEFNKDFDTRLKDAKSIILPYPKIETASIFEKYFAGQKPFGGADKKSEFPDAIAIESLIQWCQKNKTVCIVLSDDSDLKGIVHPQLIIESDYKAFLHNTLNKIVAERKETLEKIFQANRQFIITEIELWLRNELDDTSIYLDVTNWMDVHDIKIPSVIVSLQGYQIASIDNENIVVEINSKAIVKLELKIDDEQYAYRDSDNKQIYYPSTTVIEVEQEFEIPVTISFSIMNKDDYDSNIEIEEFNNGKKIEPYDPHRYDY